MTSDNLLKLLDIAIAVLGLIAGLLIGGGVSYDIGYRKGQTDALRCHQEYEMIISYRTEIIDKPMSYPNGEGAIFTELITDTIYIPVDTTFVKK